MLSAGFLLQSEAMGKITVTTVSLLSRSSQGAPFQLYFMCDRMCNSMCLCISASVVDWYKNSSVWSILDYCDIQSTQTHSGPVFLTDCIFDRMICHSAGESSGKVVDCVHIGQLLCRYRHKNFLHSLLHKETTEWRTNIILLLILNSIVRINFVSYSLLRVF